MAGKGGARVGAGRKPVHEEIKARDLAISAIVSKFGSLEKGLVSLLDSGEPTLVKFVYEHAIGKPKDTIDHQNNGQSFQPFVFYAKPSE
jgi:hypothetical protein